MSEGSRSQAINPSGELLKKMTGLRVLLYFKFYFNEAAVMASRTWPLLFFKAADALERVAPAASITTATGVRLPLSFKARDAVS